MKHKILTVTPNPAIDQTLFIPGFNSGEVNRVESSFSNAGGKGVNVASLLSDFGFNLTVTGFLGKQNTAIFEEFFQKKNIEDKFLRIDGTTRTGIKIINEKRKETTDINFPGAIPTQNDIEKLFEIIKKEAANVDWLVLAGSLPKGINCDLYKQIIVLANKFGLKTALDTSGLPLKTALDVSPTLIKPNIDELQELTGVKFCCIDEIVKAVRNMVDNGIETVVVSMGADGALFVEENEVFFVKPGKVNLISTVGAGDAMVAGTISGKIKNLSLEKTAKLATAFSMSALERLEPGLPDKKILNSIIDSVNIELFKPA